MTATTDRDIEYLVRRFTLEKGYAVACEEDEEGTPVVSALDPSRFGYPLPTLHVPEVESLKRHFDVVLIRAIGIYFIVLGIKKYEGQGVTASLSLDTLLEVGHACLPYTGKYSGAKMAVFIDIVEVHRNDPSSADVERLDALRHPPVVGRKVVVNTYSVGFRSGTVHSQAGRWTVAGARAKSLRRILRAPDEPERRMVERAERAGLNVPLVLTGAVAGLALALAARVLLATLGAESRELYGGADFAGGFAAIWIAVYARRIRAASVVQAFLAVVCYSLLLYGGLVVVLGAPFSFWMVGNAIGLICTGVFIGSQSEMV